MANRHRKWAQTLPPLSGPGPVRLSRAVENPTMMWSVVILLAAALNVESYIVHDQYERFAHGRQLRIFLPKGVEKLEFTPVDDPNKTFMCWERGRVRMNKGRVSGTGSDRRWYIDKVTYDDEGTYVQRDFWNKELSIIRVAVTPRHNYVKCIAGESLYISLEGIDLGSAFLSFSGEAGNFTLIRDGSPVSQDLSNYWDRVQTHSMNIEIKNVNYSDVGHYTLKDRKDRVVSVTRMDLTDHHDPSGSPLMALLLLLGIPAGICCCCRKKIFRKKDTTATTLQTVPDAVVHSPTGPVGPAPPYNMYYHGPDYNMGPAVHPPPPNTGPGQWTGPPPPTEMNPAYPPQYPAYPPAGTAVFPPAQPPQWNGPPQGQYPPGPLAPMSCGPAPVMYSSPPPLAASELVQDNVKMENLASSPADPLLTSAPQAEAAPYPVDPVPPFSTTALGSSDATCQFKISGGNNSTNFL
ncbi:wu:fc21g02 isoform X2 [Channa argus]|uniref:wu:fc21g02 isoform X2 n=1 Tax=Channa argus TaxID=215402 RepID=UPI0035224B7D